MPGDENAPEARRFLGTTRLEAFSDGVFAIAITLLVLDLAIPRSGRALERVLDAWPFYLAYVVSFLTIGAAWLAHTAITDRLTKADLSLLRLNLLLLLVVAVLPFPTRLVAEGLDDVSGERVFVTMYGLALVGIRVLLYGLDAYARLERLYAPGSFDESDSVRRSILPVVAVYGVAIIIGLVVPAVAVGLYCAIAVFLVVPFGELKRPLARSSIAARSACSAFGAVRPTSGVGASPGQSVRRERRPVGLDPDEVHDHHPGRGPPPADS